MTMAADQPRAFKIQKPAAQPLRERNIIDVQGFQRAIHDLVAKSEAPRPPCRSSSLLPSSSKSLTPSPESVTTQDATPFSARAVVVVAATSAPLCSPRKRSRQHLEPEEQPSRHRREEQRPLTSRSICRQHENGGGNTDISSGRSVDSGGSGGDGGDGDGGDGVADGSSKIAEWDDWNKENIDPVTGQHVQHPFSLLAQAVGRTVKLPRTPALSTNTITAAPSSAGSSREGGGNSGAPDGGRGKKRPLFGRDDKKLSPVAAVTRWRKPSRGSPREIRSRNDGGSGGRGGGVSPRVSLRANRLRVIR